MDENTKPETGTSQDVEGHQAPAEVDDTVGTDDDVEGHMQPPHPLPHDLDIER